MTNVNVDEAYNKQADDYDRFIVKLIPDYLRFNALIPRLAAKPGTVLDIGCGTGNTSARILEAYPKAKLTCIDPSPAMIGIARRKLGDSVTFMESPVEAFQTEERFDLAVSVMVMHNIQTTARRQEVYEKIYSALNPGGAYVSVDIFKGECDLSQKLFMKYWRDFMLESMPMDEVDGKWLALYKEKDKPLKMSEQLAMLKKAGFSSVDIIHKSMNFGLILALK